MKDHRAKPKRSTKGHQGVLRTRPQACPKCRRTLEEGRYHECPDQPRLSLPES